MVRRGKYGRCGKGQVSGSPSASCALRALLTCAPLLAGACAPPGRVPLTATWHATAVPIGLSVASDCVESAGDRDVDGLTDACELALARAFAPWLVIAEGGCNWDTSVTPARPGGEYYFAARPLDRAGAMVRIAYLPAYYRDCGWRGLKCMLPFVECGPHNGDSEAIVLDVAFDERTARWSTTAVFLSAHCFSRTGADCLWYRGQDLERFEWRGGGGARSAPRVWVAEGRNANYPSRSACDRGHGSLDTCDRNRLELLFPVSSTRQNLGSRTHPVAGHGCVTGQHAGWNSRLPTPDSVECFWSRDRRFHGWQASSGSEGATPYFRYLHEIAGF